MIKSASESSRILYRLTNTEQILQVAKLPSCERKTSRVFGSRVLLLKHTQTHTKVLVVENYQPKP